MKTISIEDSFVAAEVASILEGVDDIQERAGYNALAKALDEARRD